MIDIFIIKLILSFVVGGVWVTVATVMAEKFGTKVGGLIAGLPSTATMVLFFTAWTQGAEVAVEATTVIPIIGGVNMLFTVSYIYLLRKNFLMAILGSLVFWAGLSVGAVLLKPDNFLWAWVFYGVALVTAYYLLEKKLSVVSQAARRIKLTVAIIAVRALISGTIIVVAVVLGRIGGPLLAGLMAMFPAMFLGTLIITYLTHGSLFSSGTMKMAVLTSVSIIVYATMVRVTYVPMGLWWGTLVSYAVAAGVGGGVYYLARRYLL